MSPAGRVLALLELVQERPGLTAPRLAAELGVGERTVRRYVETLQDLDIPVEAGRGRYGGYRLRPGFRMPPLMLSTDEAVAVTLALALAGPGGVTTGGPEAPVAPAAAAAALNKLRRALPRAVSDRMDDVLAAVVPPDGSASVVGADPGVLASLAGGVVAERRCRVRHRAADGTSSVREIDPYGVVVVWGACYVHAWCHLRRAPRTFRVDRIDRVDLLAADFRRPAGLDVRAAVERSLALSRPEYAVSILLDAPLVETEEFFPRSLVVCEDAGAGRTRLRSSSTNLDYFVLRISDHPFAMTVEEPTELRAAFARAAERMAATAEAVPIDGPIAGQVSGAPPG